MDINKLITLIEVALVEADDFVARYYDGNDKPMISTKKTLSLLKEELQSNPESINERVLRAMHDIGATAVKSYENTPLEGAISDVTGMLYYGIPHYKNLKPLRMDFGKGNPV